MYFQVPGMHSNENSSCSVLTLSVLLNTNNACSLYTKVPKTCRFYLRINVTKVVNIQLKKENNGEWHQCLRRSQSCCCVCCLILSRLKHCELQCAYFCAKYVKWEPTYAAYN